MFFCELSNNAVRSLAGLSPWCPEVCDRHTLEVDREHFPEVFRRIDCDKIRRHGDTNARWTRDAGEEKVQGGEASDIGYLIAQLIQSYFHIFTFIFSRIGY